MNKPFIKLINRAGEMKHTTLIIQGQEFVYNDEIEDITYDTIFPISEEDIKCLLQKTKELFSLIELPFYLAYGTLLGAVRDHALIPGDEDVDVFILNEQTLFNKLPFLYQNGFKVCRIIAGCLYSFRVNENSYIDVYILKPYKFAVWGLTCYSLCKYATPKKYFREYSEIDFLGDTYLCPKDPEKLLEFWYGKNWRIPVSGHNFCYEILPAHYWHTYIVPFTYTIVKRMIGYKYWRKK